MNDKPFSRFDPQIKYVVCEVKAQMCKNDGDVILDGRCKTEEEAATDAKKYGYVGDNYIIKRVEVPYR